MTIKTIYQCPDCLWETEVLDTERVENYRGCGWPREDERTQATYKSQHSDPGFTSSPGPAGPPLRSTPDSETPDRPPIGASTTRDDGSNSFQGQTSHIFWRLNEVGSAEFTLTACFDSLTTQRLKERVSGARGRIATDGAGSLNMTMLLEPRSM